MNITQEATGEMTALVHVNLNEEDYREKVDKKLKEYRRKAQMPGFRPGMVPMGMIKKMYGKSVLADEINNLVSEALNNHILDNKLDLLGYPLPNEEKTKTLDFDNQKEFDFFFDIALAPEVNIDLSKIKAPYYKVVAGDEEIKKAVEDLQKNNANVEEQEEVAEDSTVTATINETDDEGNIVEGGFTKSIEFKIDEIKTQKNRKLFIGKKKEDEVTAVPYELFGTKEAAARILGLDNKKDENIEKKFNFKIEKIEKRTLPELNEEFYKKLFPDKEIKTEADFKKAVKEVIEQQYEKDSDRQFLNDVSEILIKESGITLPEDFMKRWLLENNRGKITKEQIDQQYDNYVKSSIWQFIEAKLQKDYPDKLGTNDEEVRDEVRKYFNNGVVPEEKDPNLEPIVDQILSNRDEKERLGQMILERKFTDFFKDTVEKEVKEVTSKEFIDIISKVN